MSLRSSLAAQIGFAAETTWGTYAAPTRFLEFNSEGIQLDRQVIESAAIRRNNRVLRSDRFVIDKRGVAGPIEFEVHDKGFGLILKHMLGTAAAPVTPGGATLTRDHVFTLGDHDGLSLSVQVGRPDVNGTTRVFTYTGIKVTEWELSNSVGGLLTLSTSLDGRDEDTGQSLGSASYASDSGLLSYVGGTINVAGSPIHVSDVTVSGSNGLKTDRHFIRSSTLKKEQVATEMVELSGSLTAEFEDLTAYNRFVNGTIASFSAIWTGRNIESSFNYSLQVDLPAVRFDGETPTVSGMDILPLSLPFKALNNGTDQPITITYRTSDTAA